MLEKLNVTYTRQDGTKTEAENVVVTGRLTKDPELRTVKGVRGETVVASTGFIANYYDNAKKEKVDEYLQLSAWDKTGERFVKAAKKGCLLVIIGQLSDATDRDKENGFNKRRLNVHSFDIVSWPRRYEGQGNNGVGNVQTPQPTEPVQPMVNVQNTEDLPGPAHVQYGPPVQQPIPQPAQASQNNYETINIDDLEDIM